MIKKKPGRKIWTGYLVTCGVTWVLFAGMVLGAGGQAPQGGGTTAGKPAYTDAEKAFAAQIGAMPLADARKAISSADASQVTEGLFRALRELGIKALDSDPDQAVVLFEEGQAVATRAGLPILAADAQVNVATSKLAAGEADESVAVFDEALAVYKAAGAPPKKIAGLLLARATASLRLGDLQASVADDKEALRISRELGDDVAVARADNGLGNAYHAAGNWAEAEAALAEALKIARAKGEKLGEAFVLNNLSTVHAAQGDFPLAIRYCEEGLKIKREVGNKVSLPSSLINLADYYDVEGREADARRVLTEAAQIGRDLDIKQAVSKATAEMGTIQLEHHHAEAALPLLEQALGLGKDSEDLGGQVEDMYEIGEAHLELKQYDLALKFSKDAIEASRGAGLLEQLSDASLEVAKTYLAMGQLKEARAALEESIGAIEELRGNVAGGATERQQFLSGKADPYRLLVSVAAMQGDWAAALDGSEKAKGRILLDLYTESGMGSSALLTEAERAEESRVRGRFVSLDMQFDRQASLPNFDPVKKSALDASRHEAKTALVKFREELYARHPELRVRRADFTALTARNMQALIPERTTALLEYELTPNGNYLFVVTRGGADNAEIHGLRLAVSSEELTRHVRRYHEQLASRNPDFAEESRWLYRALLSPARVLLRDVNSLVIVPDGMLWQVPFQALMRGDGKFLVESAAIDYVPSLAVLGALKSLAVGGHRARTLLAMGNPGGETEEQADEALALKKLYGEKNARTLIGKAATLGRFREISPTSDVVHIAAHGIFDDHDPMSSHMVLAAESGQPQDGWLRAREIQGMQLKAELVVLSGCETGKGSFQDGEGLVGMSWAALAAGAHGSLASAWRVEASSTTEMMIAFHQNMLQGVSKAESLRRAELKLLHGDKYGHPFYWAAFVLMGDGTV